MGREADLNSAFQLVDPMLQEYQRVVSALHAQQRAA
jgi:hypothetical protein